MVSLVHLVLDRPSTITLDQQHYGTFKKKSGSLVMEHWRRDVMSVLYMVLDSPMTILRHLSCCECECVTVCIVLVRSSGVRRLRKGCSRSIASINDERCQPCGD